MRYSLFPALRHPAVLLLGVALPWLPAQTADAQTVLTTANGIVRNSLCVGGDCQAGIAFDDSTIILKENNTRLKFADTSTGSFPNRDWELEANQLNNGGRNQFAILDCGTASDNGGCGSPTANVFTVEAGAGSNALYVDDGGRVGLGTSTPSVELHVIDGDTPTLRLAQDGSSGFAPQTWDMAGNETSFFIRDTTNGSTLPFRIRPSAPSQALVIDTDGDVGIGILTAEAQLHVRQTDGSATVLVEEASSSVAARGLLTLRNNGTTFLTLEDTSIAAGDDTGRSWNFQNQGGTFRVTTAPGGAGDIEMILTPQGDLTIEGDLFTTGGVCSAGCDRVFDADYPLPSITEQATMMFADRHLPNVGPTPEDGPFNVTQKMAGMLNELEKAHIYIAELHQSQTRTQAQSDAVIATLTARLASVEAALAAR